MAPDCPLPLICDPGRYDHYCAYKPFGPDADCTFDVCCPEYSAYAYVPGLAPNVTFLALFAVAFVVHIVIGWEWKQWWFMGCMVAGCLDEILGYVGRVWMNQDLWNFKAFMIQVVCVTTAPVFFCAAIYVLLAKTQVTTYLSCLFTDTDSIKILTFGPSFSRFNPALFYWTFIPCDIISLALQAAGGALSSISSGKNDKGVHLALAGLALQVITLVIFCGLYGDYLWRYFRSEEFKTRAITQRSFGPRLKLFYAFEALAVVAILVRCAFRVHELKKGYNADNKMLQKEGLFIALEGVPILLAAFFLAVGHPGLIFGDATRSPLISSSKERVGQNKEQTAERPAEGANERPAERPAEERSEAQSDGQSEEGAKEASST